MLDSVLVYVVSVTDGKMLESVLVYVVSVTDGRFLTLCLRMCCQ